MYKYAYIVRLEAEIERSDLRNKKVQKLFILLEIFYIIIYQHEPN